MGCPPLAWEASGQVTGKRGFPRPIKAGRESPALETTCAKAWKGKGVWQLLGTPGAPECCIKAVFWMEWEGSPALLQGD